MSTFDNPFDPQRRLSRSGCNCGRHDSQAEHDRASQFQCAAVESEDARYQGVVASAVMRAIFPQDAARRAFLKSVGEKKYPVGQFFEASPHMNILLYPSAVKFKRKHKLPAKQFQYLEGCVRKEVAYKVPAFKANDDKPLLYVSYGSLGSGDTELLKRMIKVIGTMPVKALVNVGDYIDQYTDIPDNVIIDKWFPQPSLIKQVAGVIHHGGNNSFTECLYFAKPAIIMPYVWDGHDNATRVEETGHGFKLNRYDWTDDEMKAKIMTMITDKTMKARLKKTSAAMRAQHGPTKAAQVIDGLTRRKLA